MKLYILPRNSNYLAMALCFVILVKRGKRLTIQQENHERIHFRQQREMLWLPFFVWYFTEFLIRYIKLGDWDKAYRAISFEQEAFACEDSLAYRAWRKPYAWVKYLSPKNKQQ